MKFKVSEILWGMGEKLDTKDKKSLVNAKLKLSNILIIVACIGIVGTFAIYFSLEGFSWVKILTILPVIIVFILFGWMFWFLRTPTIKINGITYRHHWGFKTQEEMDAEIKRLTSKGIQVYSTSLEKDVPRYQVYVMK